MPRLRHGPYLILKYKNVGTAQPPKSVSDTGELDPDATNLALCAATRLPAPVARISGRAALYATPRPSDAPRRKVTVPLHSAALRIPGRECQTQAVAILAMTDGHRAACAAAGRRPDSRGRAPPSGDTRITQYWTCPARTDLRNTQTDAQVRLAP